MSSAERPEADVAEQSRDVVGYDDRPVDQGPGADLDAETADVLEQMQDAGPDEDEAPRSG